MGRGVPAAAVPVLKGASPRPSAPRTPPRAELSPARRGGRSAQNSPAEHPAAPGPGWADALRKVPVYPRPAPLHPPGARGNAGCLWRGGSAHQLWGSPPPRSLPGQDIPRIPRAPHLPGAAAAAGGLGGARRPFLSLSLPRSRLLANLGSDLVLIRAGARDFYSLDPLLESRRTCLIS